MMRWSWLVRFPLRECTKRSGGRNLRWQKRTLEVEALEERALPSTFTVNNTNDSGPGSLRQAILDSNSHTGQNTIQFQIATSGVQTIMPLTGLPTITNSVIIDGTTEPGFDPTNPKPMIELNGGSAGYGVVGLWIQASQTTVKGLIIDSFKSLGIYISGGSQDVIQTCYIGTSVDGRTALSNGVEIYGSNNLIGGTSPGTGNTISGGLELYGSTATGNVIEGNRIGTTPDGMTALANTGDGLDIVFGASNNIIGGTVAGSGNIISAYKQYGIRISVSGTTGNIVEGNFIGTNALGTAALANEYGVFIDGSASNNTIGGTASGAGNIISGNSFDGVHIFGTGTSGNVVQGNRIGTTADGTAALANGLDGVYVYNGASNNTVGGTGSTAGNLISGNTGYGVDLYGSGVTGNLVQGNRIGTTADGKSALPNGNGGVSIAVGASSNTVGGTAAGAGNVISGNKHEGIDIFWNGTTQNLVEGNFIGTTADGNAPLGNVIGGVSISGGATSNTVGGTAAGAGNLISGNGADGVGIDGPATTGNLVEGNYIGTNAAGTAALGNGHSGVSISGGTSGNTVGGTATGAGNLISGNGSPSAGVGIAGVFMRDSGTTGNLVEGNLIGTNAAGTAALPNREAGVELFLGPSNNTIGGTAAGAGNTISGNAGPGVYFDYYLQAMTGNVIQGNRIGTTADGSAPLPNQSHGVYIFKDPHDTSGSNIGASNNTIGGTAAGAGNLIAYNGGVGVDVTAGTGNAILGNAIYANWVLGIDLGDNGVTPNDSLGHTGPNNFQNFPAISTGSSPTMVTGTLHGAASTTFRVEFFANASADPSGYGQGQTFVGFQNVTTDATGQATFSANLSLPAGEPIISATATDPGNNTSEFSQAINAPVPSVSIANNYGQGYAALDFNQSGGAIPPDTAGAAGPTSYVETVNQTLAIYSPKATGATATTSSFANFWFTAGGLARADSGSSLTDPAVVYNDQIGRFIVGDVDVDLNTHVSTFDIAVSKTSNPATLTSADWNFYQIVTTESGFDADYPGNYGYNHDAFVFTLNMYRGSVADHCQVVSISNADLMNGVGQASLHFFRNDFSGFNERPTVMHDAVAGDPMWLVTEHGDNKSIDVVKMGGVLSSSATFTSTNLAVTPYSAAVSILNPDGTAITGGAESQIMKAAEWNHTLVAAHSVSVSTTEDDAQWYVIDLSGAAPALKDQGRISAGNHTYVTFPSIDLNAAGQIGMTYMKAGNDTITDYLSMYVTGRNPSDPAGTMEASGRVPAGTGKANYHDFSSGGRAGDLSGISVDPSDGSFWASNEFANTEATANWGTAVANFTIRNTVSTTHFSVTPSVPSTTAGTAFSVTVSALDASNNVDATYRGTIHFTSSDTHAGVALPADYTFVAADNGVHTFTNGVTLVSAGNQSVTATDTQSATITGSATVTVNPATASSLVVAGFPSPTTAGMAGTVTVTANDPYGNTATGYTGTVHFTSSDSQAVLPPDYTFTAANAGVHTFNVTLKTAGSQSLTATDTVTSTITGSQTGITVNPASASTLALTGFASPSTAGTAGSFTVTAKDPYGNTASGYAGTVSFTSTDAQALLPANYTFVAADAGVHAFSATLKTAGSQSLTATDTSTSTITGSQTGISVNPASASTLALTGFASPATAGTAGSFTVRAKDPYGNTASGYAGTVNFTSSDAQALLPANYTFVAADAGVHAFSATLKTAGSQSLTATDTSTSTITGSQTGITVNPAAADHLLFAVQPSNTVAGVAISPAVSVQILDKFNNLVTTDNSDGVGIAIGTNPNSGTLSGATTVTASGGVATFSNLSINKAGNGYTLTASSGSLAAATSTSFAITPAAASTFNVAGFPSPVVSGQAQNFTVTALDAFGNTATGYGGKVHFASTDLSAALPTDYTFVTADAGVHRFSATLETAATQSLTATDAATASITGTQTGILVKPASFLVSGFPSPTTAGVAHTFSVTAQNANGTTATGYTGTVHFTSSDGQAVLPADYAFTSTDAGVHSFTATLKTAGTRSLTAADSAVTSVTGTQSNITVNAAAVSALAVTGFPSPTVAGVVQTFTVTAQDPYGNTVASYRGTVKFSSSDKQASLPGPYTFASTDNGVHSFSATLKTAGSQSLTATDTKTATITGTQTGITVNPAAAKTLAVAGFPSPTTAGIAHSFTVTAKDAFGNIATGYAGTVHFTSSDSQAVLPSDYTFVGSDAGVHSFSATLKTAGSRSITAKDTVTAAITGAQTGITVNATAASKLMLSPPSSTTAGAAFTLTVTAQDPYGNTATSYTGTVKFTSSDSQATLPANYTFISSDAGKHTFTNAVTLKTAGKQTITATDTVTASITGSATVNVTAAAASTLTVSAPATVTAGTAFTLTVTALDPYGNKATGYRGTVHFTSSDPKAVLPADYSFTSADNGVHSFNRGATLKTAGTQSITATDTVTSTITGQANIKVSAAAASTLVVSGFPSPIAHGTAASFTVTVEDAYGNIATGYLGTVHFTSSDTKASLPANYKFTAADAGVHTFTATLNTSGTQSITATDTLNSTITGTESGIQVTAATVERLFGSDLLDTDEVGAMLDLWAEADRPAAVAVVVADLRENLGRTARTRNRLVEAIFSRQEYLGDPNQEAGVSVGALAALTSAYGLVATKESRRRRK